MVAAAAGCHSQRNPETTLPRPHEAFKQQFCGFSRPGNLLTDTCYSIAFYFSSSSRTAVRCLNNHLLLYGSQQLVYEVHVLGALTWLEGVQGGGHGEGHLGHNKQHGGSGGCMGWRWLGFETRSTKTMPLVSFSHALTRTLSVIILCRSSHAPPARTAGPLCTTTNPPGLPLHLPPTTTAYSRYCLLVPPTPPLKRSRHGPPIGK